MFYIDQELTSKLNIIEIGMARSKVLIEGEDDIIAKLLTER